MTPEPTTPLLTDTQRRITGFAITLLALLGSIALFITAFIVLGKLVGFFSSVIWPLAVAGVLALILRPVVDIIEVRLGVGRTVAVIVLYGLFVLAVAGSLVLIVPPLIDQSLQFVAYLPTLWENITTYFETHYPHWVETLQRHLNGRELPDFSAMLAEETKAILTHALPSLRVAFGGVLDAFAFVANIVIIPVYLFFFLLMRGDRSRDLGRHFPFLRPTVREDITFLTNEFVAILVSFFRGQLLIGLCMGVLYAIGFTAIGLKFGLFIGLALGFLNIIPYLGTILGLATAIPLAFFQPDGGGLKMVGLTLVVTLVVQTIEGWVLTPKIMGDRTGLHPVTIIFAVFFWGIAFGGVLGMLLAVPLTAFFVTAWRFAKRKYFQASRA